MVFMGPNKRLMLLGALPSMLSLSFALSFFFAPQILRDGDFAVVLASLAAFVFCIPVVVGQGLIHWLLTESRAKSAVVLLFIFGLSVRFVFNSTDVEGLYKGSLTYIDRFDLVVATLPFVLSLIVGVAAFCVIYSGVARRAYRLWLSVPLVVLLAALSVLILASFSLILGEWLSMWNRSMIMKFNLWGLLLSMLMMLSLPACIVIEMVKSRHTASTTWVV
jgi:hypothetical protein